MIASILTTIFFALSAVFGKRTADIFGSLAGNFWRLAIATAALGAITLAFDPRSFAPATFLWFLVSGIVGFGIGDIGLFLAYRRLGSRLTILINLCLAPVFGALGEYLWLGTAISPGEGLASLVALAGVGVALRPRPGRTSAHGSLTAGVLLAVLAGFGQGMGAVISRHAQAISEGIGLEVGGTSAAFQRIIGGVAIALAAHLTARQAAVPVPPPRASPAARVHGLAWLAGAALFGPVIGVSCFQWALSDTPSALVLAITSTTPIVLIPMAWLIEGDRPTRDSLTGAAIAVAGVVAICLLR